MGRSKELYIAEVERLMSLGMDYDRASDVAADTYMDRLIDRADNDRKRMKEEGTWPAQSTK